MSSFAAPVAGDVKLERDAVASTAVPAVPGTPAIPAYDSIETGIVPFIGNGRLWVNPPGVSMLGVQPFNPRGDYFVLPSYGPIYGASESDPYYGLGFVLDQAPTGGRNFLVPRWHGGDSYQYVLRHPAVAGVPEIPAIPDRPPYWDAIGIFAKPLVFDYYPPPPIYVPPDPGSQGAVSGGLVVNRAESQGVMAPLKPWVFNRTTFSPLTGFGWSFAPYAAGGGGVAIDLPPPVQASTEIGMVSFYPDPTSIGIVAGFVRNVSWGPGLVGDPPTLPFEWTKDPSSVPFAFFIARGQVTIVEYGVTKFDVGTIVEGDKLAIYLNNPKVLQFTREVAYGSPYSLQFLKNDVVVYTRHLEGLELVAFSSSLQFLFLASKDRVRNTTLTSPPAYGAGRLSPLRWWRKNAATLAPLVTTGFSLGNRIRSAGRLAALVGAGADVPNYAYAADVLAGLFARGRVGTAGTSRPGQPSGSNEANGPSEGGDYYAQPVYNISQGFLAQPTVFGKGTVQNHVVSNGQLRPLFVAAADVRSYAYQAALLPPIVVRPTLPFLRLQILDRMGGHDRLQADAVLYVITNEQGGVRALFTVKIGSFATLASRMGVSSSYSVLLRLFALISSRLGIANAPLELEGNEDLVDVWVVNTDTNASTRYEQFDFNSYALIDGQYYGARTDGIYRLEGETDVGFPIRASINFGKQNFGSTLEKRVPTAYIGVASSGLMVMKVITEGVEYLYTARDGSEQLQTQRIEFGKGLKANFYEFEIYNGDGGDFDLASIEFAAVNLSRRV